MSDSIEPQLINPHVIEPRLKKIGEYLKLNSQEIFVVPEYQRGYSWEITQCEKLWQDMEAFMENAGRDPYFFGTVIVSCENSTLTLIDGQQRTTTFILLLKALLIQLNSSIKHTERDEDSRRLHNTLVRKRDKIISILYKVTDDGVDEIVENFGNAKISNILKNESINEQYGSDLETILKSETFDNAEEKVVRIPYKQKDKKYTNYFKNFNFFYDQFKVRSDSWINIFTEYILDKSEIIEIRSWNVEQAITMFNSLNSAGMPLTDADIISAQLYSNAKENRNIFDKKWKELRKIVKEDIENDCKINIDAVLLQYMYINRSVDEEYISKSGSVDVTTPGIRSYYTDKRKDLLQEPLKLVDSFLKVAKIWDKIQDYSIIKLSFMFNNNIKLYLISYLYRFDLDELNENKVEAFLQHLLKIFVILEVLDTVYSSSKFKRFLFGLNVKLVKKEIELDIIKKEIQDHIHKEWNEEEITKDIAEYDKKALTYLFEYIFCLHNQKIFELKDKYEVEHILPQSGKNIKQMKKDAGFTKDNEHEFEYIVDKLGNKIVLEKKINVDVSNAWFRTKCGEYIKSSYKVAIAIAEEYANDDLPVWKIEDIDRRTEEIAEEIVDFIFS